MPLDLFHPLIADWFRQRFGAPTEPQRRGWPAIASGMNTLIAAPTGSGKTLAAFLVCIDRLFRQWLDGELADGTQVVYVSPLKALSNDIERNLQAPLAEIAERAVEARLGRPPLRAAVRTGDTPTAERQQMLRSPPHILVTTPESLYLLLTSEKARQKLRGVKTVIVDEIHSLARDKRGSHLTLTLERLAHLCDRPPVRIGLSATQRPIETIASFLSGVNDEGQPHSCHIVDGGHARRLDLEIDVPPSELQAVCSGEQWSEVYQRLVQLIESHRSTLIFVNTRRMAERIAFKLIELLGEEAVASHHGSLSRETRLSAERRLKEGKLKAIVATASLEMGIDIGYIDLVCQIGSPRSIASLLQRVGRAGHSLGATPKGRLFPLTRDELLECLALVRAIRRGVLDAIEIPESPLDILAQQIVAATACDEWGEENLYRLMRRAWPFRNLARADYDSILALVSEGLTPTSKRGAFVHRDQIHGQLRARAGARIAALTSGGAIPEAPLYRVVTENDRTFVGTIDEHFAIDSSAGDIFVLGNTSWQIAAVRGGEVVVRDAQGAPPTVPFWFGEAPGRTIELSDELSALRQEIARRIAAGSQYERLEEDAPNDSAPTQPPASTAALSSASATIAQVSSSPASAAPSSPPTSASEWLRCECGADDWAAGQAVRYVAAQLAAVGSVPTGKSIVFERFFDESGGMQLVIHSPLGHRINRAWGMALRKRFCRSFDFELQAAATDNGILLSVGPQHSFPIEQLFKMLGPHNARELLQQAVLAQPVFPLRWRWNVSRSLAILRFSGGKKVPFHIQRFRADDLLAAAFPETVGCLENHHGDIEIPDHPLVQQTMRDCLTEAMDVDRWLDVIRQFQAGAVQFIACNTREPSPFSHELINANPYAFLDPADAEERRTRAVTLRRGLSTDEFRDLTRLDPAAIEQVVAEAWPVVRSADELHDALLNMVVVRVDEAVRPAEGQDWSRWFEQLEATGRALRVTTAQGLELWVASERWPLVRAVYPNARASLEPRLPASLAKDWETSDAWVELLKGRMQFTAPATASEIGARVGIDESPVFSALEAVEGQGLVLRGRFTGRATSGGASGSGTSGGGALSNGASSGGASLAQNAEWCDRRLLARMHRLTLDGLRRRIQPVGPDEFIRFLARHQRLGDPTVGGPQAVRDMLVQLQGFEMSAAAWERQVLGPRIAQYDPRWLDELFLAGEATWGRLRPPQREAKEATEVPTLASKKRSRSATIEDAEMRQLPTVKEPSETRPSDKAASEEPREEPRWAAMTRAMPMSIVLREELPWLLPVERTDLSGQLRPDAARVLSTIRNRGALFVAELRMLTGLSLERLDDALGELAAVGLVTSDAFAAVRAMVARRRDAARRASASGAEPRDEASSTDATTRPSGGSLDWRRGPTGLATGGRWSQFPGVWGLSVVEESVVEESGVDNSDVEGAGVDKADSQRSKADARDAASPTQGPSRIERWCWQLLRRYGVVFRDVLTRESAAPTWYELVPTFRRMELRGEIRGGRFVSGVSGEQYATESAVTALRQVRDSAPGDWLLVSASDPLNLSGIIVPGPRIPAVHKNALILAAGRCVAARKGGKIEFFVDDLDPQVKAEMTLALHHLRRRQAPAKPPAAAPAMSAPPPPPLPPPSPAPRPPDKVRQIRDRWSSF